VIEFSVFRGVALPAYTEIMQNAEKGCFGGGKKSFSYFNMSLITGCFNRPIATGILVLFPE
jgi:hypothetical protein